MSERRYLEVEEDTDPICMVIGVRKPRSRADLEKNVSSVSTGHEKHLVGSLLVLLFVLYGCLPLVVADLGDGLGEVNLTLQNDRIYCWGRSYDIGTGADLGESYPEHLDRLLGAEVDHCTWGNMRPGTSTATLEAASYFEDHKYGVIIMRMSYDGPSSGIPWNVTEDNLRRIIRRLQDTGAVLVFFEAGPLWDLDGQLTTTHDECLTGTSHAMVHPYIVCGSIDDETQTAKYVEWWGETVFCTIAREEGAYFLSDSLRDCLEEGEESCPPLTNLDPDLESGDDWHPNSMGYGVLAEKVAECLVDWGLAEYAVDLDKLSRDLPAYLAEAEDKVSWLEERNHPPMGELEKEYRMAEFVYDHGFLYTANRTLVGEVLPRVTGVFENFDEIEDMFTKTWECIQTLNQTGDTRTTLMCAADYDRASNAWAEYDHVATRTYLEKIIAKCCPELVPERVLLPVLSFVLLLLLLRMARNGASSG